MPRLLAWSLILASGLHATDAQAQDRRNFSNGASVDVYVNWQSCLDEGFAASDKDLFYSTVIDAYTRWMHVAGVDLDLKARGYTSAIEANTNQIVVSCNTFHNNSWHPDWNLNGQVDGTEPNSTCTTGAAGCNCWDCNRLASTYGSTGGLKIVVHKKSGQNLNDWAFTLTRDTTGTNVDLFGILMHELGHAMGLDHGNLDDLMNGGYTDATVLGPRPDDISDLRAQYNLRGDLRFGVHRSTNSGTSWSEVATNLDDIGLTTTNPATFTRDYYDNQTLLTYTDQNKHPSWIMGNRDGNAFDTGGWYAFGGLHSLYGTGGGGYDDEYMMTWVDGDSPDNAVKLVYSSNDAASWSWRNPPAGSRSRGTPAVAKVAANTWVLAYASVTDITNPNWNATGASEMGRILVRVSTNDGASWGPEIELNSFYRARGGVSIAADGTGEIRIGFAWDGTTSSTRGRMRTLVGHISGSSMVYDGVITDYTFNTFTRTFPSTAKPSTRFLRSWREGNFDTSINTELSEEGSTSWGNYVRVLTTSHVNPALAADNRSSWSYLYTLR